ncbi:MAG: TRAP transporter small permease, partial [Desulfobacterales bacterium]
LITWRMADYAGTIRESGQVSMNLEFPEYLIIYAVSFCFLIFTLLIIKDIVGLSRRLLKGEK